MKILCIGGCKDGQQVEIATANPYVRFAIPQPLSVPDYSEDTTDYSTTMDVDTYRRESLHTTEERFEFLVHEDVSIEDMIRLLIQNYSPLILSKDQC